MEHSSEPGTQIFLSITNIFRRRLNAKRSGMSCITSFSVPTVTNRLRMIPMILRRARLLSTCFSTKIFLLIAFATGACSDYHHQPESKERGKYVSDYEKECTFARQNKIKKITWKIFTVFYGKQLAKEPYRFGSKRYDRSGKLIETADWFPNDISEKEIQKYYYDSLGRLSIIDGWHERTTFQYDTANRISLRAKYRFGDLEERRSYLYDHNGFPTKEETKSNLHTSYDDIVFDNHGNKISEDYHTYIYNGAGFMTADSFSFPLNGWYGRRLIYDGSNFLREEYYFDEFGEKKVTRYYSYEFYK